MIRIKTVGEFLQLNGGGRGTAPPSKAPLGMSWSAFVDRGLFALKHHIVHLKLTSHRMLTTLQLKQKLVCRG